MAFSADKNYGKRSKERLTRIMDKNNTPVSKNNPDILLADNNQTSLDELGQLLSQSEANIHIAKSADETLKLASQYACALILIEVDMPQVSGIELAYTISTDAQYHHAPIVLYSAQYQDESVIIQGYENGAVDYFILPINPTIFLAKVGLFLSRYVQKQQLTTALDKQQKLLNELDQLAHYDPLTGLYNRRQLRALAASIEITSKRYGGKFAVLMLDIDGFKDINDTHGHDVGDKLLINIAKRLQHNLRVSDVLARLGGDEFAIIVPKLDSYENAALLAKKILKALEQPYLVNDIEMNITASIGIACFPHAGDSVGALFKCADIALYSAKEAGKNTYHFFSLDLDNTYKYKALLRTELKKALKRKEF